MHTELFGQTADGEIVEIHTLTNRHGLMARVTSRGAGLVEMHVPDRDGVLGDVTLGFDCLDGYLAPHPHFGVTTGRFANRIANGTFVLDGVTYQLAANEDEHHLHGGAEGFGRRNWKSLPHPSGEAVRFAYTSPDGEEGYPGTLEVAVTYTLNDANELRLDYEATTDKPTIINLTNHAYWNLAGAGDILKHEVAVSAQKFVAVNGSSIPTGRIDPVAGGPMDFTRPKAIGKDLAQLTAGVGGYDHTFVLDRSSPGELTLAAEVFEPLSGRVMTIWTTEPGIQLYSGNYLDGSVTGKGGVAYQKRSGLCLETQHYPDSPNQPHFPSTVLRPGERYRTKTVHRFSTR